MTHEKDKGTVTDGAEEVHRGGRSQCGNLRARSALEGPKHREVPRPDLHFQRLTPPDVCRGDPGARTEPEAWTEWEEQSLYPAAS